MTDNSDHTPYPPEIRQALNKAVGLEWATLFWLTLVVLLMTWAMGGSQAFKTAWIEDILSLLAPASFLIAHHLEKRPPDDGFPFGFHRAGSLAFFFSSAALALIGLFLLYDGTMALIKAEHPTIGSKEYFGVQIWSGWIMITVLAFSVVPSFLLGRRKRKIAKQLHDKILFVDAETNVADWQTGLASIIGVAGIGLGLWWADAAMAILISLSIIKDGFSALKGATISLLDGAPRQLDSHKISEDAKELIQILQRRYPGHRVQVRETGRFFRAQVHPKDDPVLPQALRKDLLPDDDWRLLEAGQAIRDRRQVDRE